MPTAEASLAAAPDLEAMLLERGMSAKTVRALLALKETSIRRRERTPDASPRRASAIRTPSRRAGT